MSEVNNGPPMTMPEMAASPVVDAQVRFQGLAQLWKAETKYLSNVTAKTEHPAYRQIISMGRDVVPLILRDMSENGPNDWFWALTIITGENPITEAIAGNMRAMTDAWLRLGKSWNYPKPLEDPSRAEWMKLGEASPLLDFWNRPEEDIYTPDDGEPL